MKKLLAIAALFSAMTITPFAIFADPLARVTAGAPFSPNDTYFLYDASSALYPGQWNLLNTAPASIHYPASVAPNGTQTAEVTIANAGLDMNVMPVWQRGYTGSGIVIGILDDGMEFGHPDLNIVESMSLGMDGNGIVAGQNGSHGGETDSHGTTVAGMAAAIGGNGIGVTGSAPQARVASIRVNNFTSFEDYHMHAPAILYQGGLGWQNGMKASQILALTTLLEPPLIPIKNSSSKTAAFSYPPRFEESYSAFARTAANGVLFAQAAGNCRRTKQQDVNTNMEEIGVIW